MSLPSMSTDGSSAYRLIDSKLYPRITFVLVDNELFFDEALEALQSKVLPSLKLSPKEKMFGIVVLPKGSSGVDSKRSRELSRSRITVRISEVDDLEVAAQGVDQEILRQYQFAKSLLITL